MKHKDFYIYQFAEIALNTGIKTIGFLFAWLMLKLFNLPQQLGVFIGISWLCQVVALLLFSWACHGGGFAVRSKPLLLTFCAICTLAFLGLFFHSDYVVFALVFIITSIFLLY